MHERITPDDMYKVLERGKPIDDHLSPVVKATGNTHVHLAGVVALTRDGDIVGENDMQKQAEKVAENIETALQSADASLEDVVRMDIYSPEPTQYAKEGHQEIVEVFGEDNLPVGTLIGADLVNPKYLVEISITAVTEE